MTIIMKISNMERNFIARDVLKNALGIAKLDLSPEEVAGMVYSVYDLSDCKEIREWLDHHINEADNFEL
jgi:hypothetical protein